MPPVGSSNVGFLCPLLFRFVATVQPFVYRENEEKIILRHELQGKLAGRKLASHLRSFTISKVRKVSFKIAHYFRTCSACTLMSNAIFIFYTHFSGSLGCSGASPSCHSAKAEPNSGQVAGLSQGHAERQLFALALTPQDNLDFQTGLTCMFFLSVVRSQRTQREPRQIQGEQTKSRGSNLQPYYCRASVLH